MATPLLDDTGQSEESDESNSQHCKETWPEVDKEREPLHEKGEAAEQLVNILVIGPTGTGKSELIKALFGEVKAKVGDEAKANTSEVEEYEREYKGVRIKFYVPVWLRNTDGRSILDSTKYSQFDLILICSKLEYIADRNMFLELASVLNEEMWKRTVVVLTQANLWMQLDSVESTEQATREKIDEHKACVIDYLSDHVMNDILTEIPFCIAGSEDAEKLPTVDDWLKALLKTCFDRCSQESRLSLINILKISEEEYLLYTGALTPSYRHEDEDNDELLDDGLIDESGRNQTVRYCCCCFPMSMIGFCSCCYELHDFVTKDCW